MIETPDTLRAELRYTYCIECGTAILPPESAWTNTMADGTVYGPVHRLCANAPSPELATLRAEVARLTRVEQAALALLAADAAVTQNRATLPDRIAAYHAAFTALRATLETP